FLCLFYILLLVSLVVLLLCSFSYRLFLTFFLFFFFLMIRRPPRSTLFPYRRSSDLHCRARRHRAGRRTQEHLLCRTRCDSRGRRDRKSTRLNSSHGSISYAVFCLKKKKRNKRY